MNEKNKYMGWLIENQKKILFILMLIILLIPIIINFAANRPLTMGAESYYHLTQAELGLPQYYPLKITAQLLGLNGLVLVPIFLAIATFFLFYLIAKQQNLSPKFTFFFMLFIILTPAFIFVHSTLSTASLIVVLGLTIFALLNNKKWEYLAIIPLALGSFIDFFSTILLIVFIVLFISFKKKQLTRWLYLGIPGILLTIQIFYKHNFFIGPFHLQKIGADLISDLGGLSGMSFFITILTIIGLSITWKRKKFYFAYILFPLLLTAYIFNTNTIYFLSIICVFFATIGFVSLFEGSWNLKNLKNYTFLIIFLGLTFSTLTYLERIDNHGIDQDMIETLEWTGRHLKQEELIITAPQVATYVNYFSKRQVLHSYQENYDLGETALQSVYIRELFPVLEQNNVHVIYITEEMKSTLPQDQGLLFLLQNERFKLRDTSGNYEVWFFD